MWNYYDHIVKVNKAINHYLDKNYDKALLSMQKTKMSDRPLEW